MANKKAPAKPTKKRKLIAGKFFKKDCEDCGKSVRWPYREGGGRYPNRCKKCQSKYDSHGRLRATAKIAAKKPNRTTTTTSRTTTRRK